MHGLESYRKIGEAAPDSLRQQRTLVFVSAAEVINDSMIYAIEREFPTLSIEQVPTLEAACKTFKARVALMLIDVAMLADTKKYAERLATVHSSAALALLIPNARSRIALEDIMAAPALRGALPMDMRLDLWLTILRLMLRGGEYIPSSLIQASIERFELSTARAEHPEKVEENPAVAAYQLTSREFEILSLVAKGFQNKLIATELSLSECTVKIHIHNLTSKLGVHNRTQAAAIFHRIGTAGFGRPAPK